MTDKKTDELSRRGLLTRIGGLAAVAYAAPAFTTMSMAHAASGASSAASANSSASSPSEPSDPSEPSGMSEASGSSPTSSASGCEDGKSWDGRTYNSNGIACLPD